MTDEAKDELGAAEKLSQPQDTAVSQASPISADWVARTKYEMAEKVEKLVWNWLGWRIIAPAVLILAFLSYIGPSLILDYVTHHIESDLKNQTAVLRQRIEDQLADMDVKTADLKSQAQTAQIELAKLKVLADEVNKITPQYNALKSQVDEDRAKVNDLEKQVRTETTEATQSSGQLKQVTSRIQHVSLKLRVLNSNLLGTQQLALGTQLGITNLGKAFTLTEAVGAIITGSGSPFFFRDISLSGQNFGDSKGKVYIQVSSMPPSLSLTGTQSQAAVELDAESVVSWNDINVILHLSDAILRKIQEARAQGASSGTTVVPGGLNFPNSLSDCCQLAIHTAAGQSSNWWFLADGSP